MFLQAKLLDTTQQKLDIYWAKVTKKQRNME
jgi:hypothetical protein